MTPDEFRSLALSLPDTTEKAHMSHPDFRVAGKIFATLSGPDEERGMVKLTPEQQAAVLEAEPAVFTPASGAWGRQGCTMLLLRAARKGSVWPALIAAWRNTAPVALVRRHQEEHPPPALGSSRPRRR